MSLSLKLIDIEKIYHFRYLWPLFLFSLTLALMHGYQNCTRLVVRLVNHF